MKNIKTYKINSNYTLEVLDEEYFRVINVNPILPDIVINRNYEDPKQAIVEIQTTAQGSLDTVDIEFYIEELEQALEVAKEIKFVLYSKYDMNVI